MLNPRIRPTRWRRPARRALLACAFVAAIGAPARAQLDPLLFVKRVPPNIVVVVDTSMRMLEDLNGYYYDPNFYRVADNTEVADLLGVSGAVTYRRKYQNLQYTNVSATGSLKFSASTIVGFPAMWDPSNSATANHPADQAYFDPTRIAMARRGILQAVSENGGAEYRWGLLKLRQDTVTLRASDKCNQPVIVSDATFSQAGDASPCNAGGDGQYAIYDPAVPQPNFSLTSGGSPTVVTPGADTSQAMLDVLRLGPMMNLIPAGSGTETFEDRPLTFALADAKRAVETLMTNDAASTLGCRNSVVVLITSGADAGDAAYKAANDAAAMATTFKTVSGGGETRRVPIYVIAIGPPATDEDELQNIATNSGGRYFNVNNAWSVTRAINLAVQAGFSRSDDFETSAPSEYTGVTPIIGTVNLKGAMAADGINPLLNDEVRVDDVSTKNIVPQRSNVMISAGFTLPDFDGKIRAFRAYRPERDATKVSGWVFKADGTRLWPDLDGRPSLAGSARAPLDPNMRNIYTALPDGAGGVNIVAFTLANAPDLAPHLMLPSGMSAYSFIMAYRALPIGAVIGSTPALMDAPSLDPPPDADYGRPDDSTLTFAATHKDRRSMIFVGANDGMIHAIDARTGYEVWAFVPYNLLPKLKTLIDGQPVEQFEYFVDSSPKIAEVKMNTATGHKWRSLLIIGQGPGGTFYQAFDVTKAGMNVAPDRGSLADVDALLQQFDAPNESVEFLWSFPNYNSFDATIAAEIPVSDATPGGIVKIYGDLKATATYVEKTVGFTWSDPAVGPLDQSRNTNAVMVGSGYLPSIETSTLLQRGGSSAPAAGRQFYLLKVEDGTLIGNPSGGSCGGNGCIDVGDEPTPGIKNALQADPSAAGDNGVPIVRKAYIGDLDGRYWRLDFTSSGSITKSEMIVTNPPQPIFSSSALLFIGSADVYMFFSTGSDLLPTVSPYGVGTFGLYALKDSYPGTGATLKFKRNLSPVTNVGVIANGERPSTAPSVAGDIVFFTTTSEDATEPCSDFTANLYAFTYLGGAAYDTDGSKSLDTNESPLVKRMAGRATSPFIVDQHLYFGTAGATGFNIEMFGDPEDFNNGVGQVGIRVLSWREIR